MKLALVSRYVWPLLIALLLLLPLTLIEGKINERRERRDSVATELAQTGVGTQQLTGPVLVLPCRERYRESRENDSGKFITVESSRDCTARFVATNLQISGAMETNVRMRGIYRVLFYGAALTITGQFDVPDPPGAAADVIARTYFVPELRIGVADVRGISDARLQWDGQAQTFIPGANEAALGSGIHALLGHGLASKPHAFRLTLALGGTRSIDFVPLARNTHVSLAGQWPHPSFLGRFLPTTRRVTERGFTADWKVSDLASDAPRAYLACRGNECSSMHAERFGVALIEPIDVYVQSQRAVSYGFLFVGLTFLVFLLFELIAALRVHPMQYMLVGLALAVFFLLLFALAEHMTFALAYVIAAIACIALITFYVSHLLRSPRRAAVFSTYLVALYGALYMLLHSEDDAMLLGALLVFAMLTVTMVLTRRMDWFGMGAVALRADG